MTVAGAVDDRSGLRITYSRFVRRKVLFLFFLFGLLVVLMLVAAAAGSVRLGIGQVLSAFLNKIFPGHFHCSQLASNIVWQLRLPRILMAAAVGMGLGIAGAAMQGILKNPLGSPYTLGIASAAGFGAALAIVCGIGVSGAGTIAVVANAFFFSMAACFLIIALARMRRATPESMILAGIAMMFLFSAMMALLQYMGTAEQVQEVVFWLMGDLSRSSWFRVGIVSAVVFASFPFLMKWSWDFNALSFGDETAKGLGVKVERTRIYGLALSSLVTAAAICFVGTIAFIGLVSPHICRMVIGSDHRFLTPASGLAGGALLVAADTLARTIVAPVVLPVGILTSFLGVPLFVYLILRRKKEYW